MSYRIAVITSSPNKDGLTAACGKAAQKGSVDTGATVDLIDLNSYDVGRCKACGTGYGTCRTEHSCQVQDDFQSLHERLVSADAYAVVTPVYWGDLSESAKAFLDRVRRCEATSREASRLSGKRPEVAAGARSHVFLTCSSCLTTCAPRYSISSR